MIDGFHKVLILGGSGFVGRHLCEHLADHRWRITVPTRRLRNAQHLCTQPKVTLLEANIHHPAELQRLVAGHDAVVNLVAILHGSAADFERVHVTLPTQLAQACHAQGVRRLVHISALGADAQHPDTLPSMYLRSKSRGEAALLAASKVPTSPSNQPAMQLTMLRPSVLFGAGDRFLNVFASLQRLFPLVPLAGAQARFQPAWVEDLAQAIVYCLNYPHHTAGKTFEICGPEVLTLKQLVQGAGQWAGIDNGQGRPVVGLPMWMGRIQAALMQLAPGEPLMSADNLDSMRVDNIATGRFPGLKDLCITPSSVRSIAPLYLSTTSQLDILRGR